MLSLWRGFRTWFRPTIDGLFTPGIPWGLRWRMFFLLQPTVLITNSIASAPWMFSRPFTTQWITVAPGQTLRVLVFKSPSKAKSDDAKLRPIHLDFHPGAFMGGIPESDVMFCQMIAEQTGAVVISSSYRLAPPHSFPAAIDDADALVGYMHENAAKEFGANPELMTTSGFSAGGNLAVAVSQQPGAHPPAKTALKGSVTFYGVMDLRLTPAEKPKSAAMPPGKDPAEILFPLMDAYASPVRAENMENPRMSPILAKLETLPEDMLVIVPAIDIIVHEQLTFVKRLQEELQKDPKQSHRKIESLFIEKAFHGWLELPEKIAGPSKRKTLQIGVDFLKTVHNKHGWEWSQ